jgi:excisionase family DNA binding protein
MNTEVEIKKINALLKNQIKEQKAVLSFREALAYLDVSKSFLYKLTSSNSITFFKPSGKLIYFKRTDLNNWVFQKEFQQTSSVEENLNNYLNRGNYGKGK